MLRVIMDTAYYCQTYKREIVKTVFHDKNLIALSEKTYLNSKKIVKYFQCKNYQPPDISTITYSVTMNTGIFADNIDFPVQIESIKAALSNPIIALRDD